MPLPYYRFDQSETYKTTLSAQGLSECDFLFFEHNKIYLVEHSDFCNPQSTKFANPLDALHQPFNDTLTRKAQNRLKNLPLAHQKQECRLKVSCSLNMLFAVWQNTALGQRLKADPKHPMPDVFHHPSPLEVFFVLDFPPNLLPGISISLRQSLIEMTGFGRLIHPQMTCYPPLVTNLKTFETRKPEMAELLIKSLRK